MKECFVITSYCNTPNRVEELKKCINNIKRFNKDILIHAHYPLDLEIQKSVDYYIYDSTNPVIRDGSKVIIRWKWYKTANKLLTITNSLIFTSSFIIFCIYSSINLDLYKSSVK